MLDKQARRFTRRDLLKASALVTGAIALQACAQPAPPAQPTQSTAANPAGGQAPTAAAVPTVASAPAQPTAAPASAAAGRPGATAVVALHALYGPPDPGQAPAFSEWFFIQNVAEPLIEFNITPDQKTEIVPVLAESYDKSSDGSVWTFKLRKGVRFHDGTAFNAEAVRFSHERLMDPNNPNYQKLFVYIGSALRDKIDKIETPDDLTVRFTLKNPPSPTFLNWEARTRIVSPAAVAKYGKDFGSNVVGTGPFRMTKYDLAGNVMEMEKNPDYWAPGLPKLDRVVWRVVPESSTRLAQLETGEADLATLLPVEFADRIKGNADLVLEMIEAPQFNTIEFWRGQQPFSDKRLRQAVAYSLDRPALAKLLYGDVWKPAVNNRWPAVEGWSDYAPYSYDPERAKSLLSDAGFSGGLEFTLEMPNAAAANPAGQRWGEAIQEQLNKAGFNVKLNVMESAAYWKGRETPHPNVAYYMSRQSWVPDAAAEWLNVWSEPLPWADIPVPGVPELMAELKKISDPAQHAETVSNIWKILDDELPYISIATGSWVMGRRKSLYDLRMLPIGEWTPFKNVHL
jgi:ABC-type transport system substrate-binding protein